jgi:methionyl-tRNA formyltransferase
VVAAGQPADGVSLAPKLTPADARVDWKLPAHLIDRQIRACTPDPGAWTDFEGARLKLWPVTPLAAPPVTPTSASRPDGAPVAAGAAPGELAPGELHVERGAVYVGTGTRPVRLGDVQPPGKRRMPAADWARGLPPASPALRPASAASPAFRPAPGRGFG